MLFDLLTEFLKSYRHNGQKYMCTFNLGSLMSEAELDSMLGEIGGPCNFDNMLKCFEVKMTGEGMANDGDQLVVEAMSAFSEKSNYIFFRKLLKFQKVNKYETL